MSRSPQGADSAQQEISALKQALQEQRRALTLLQAEAEKERQLREALEAQLLEANAEIVASWDRRKEMARVITDRERQVAEARNEIKAHKQRRHEMAQIITGRGERLAQLQQELETRYQELAALQRHMMLYSPAGWTKLLVRRARRIGGK